MKQSCIHLGPDLVRALEHEAERRYPNETGGVLLGFADPDDDEQIQLIAQIGPGPKASHEAFRFEPDSEWQQQRITEAYEQSGRVLTYLGDWHSHPRGGKMPSSLDRETAKKIARCAEARAPHPLILIVYGEPESWQIVAYRRQRWKLREVTVWRDEGNSD